jgi:BMFP domain-containing protein YqiC
MSEHTPDNGKNLMEEAVDIVRADRRARDEKNDRLLLRYIGGLFFLTILLTVYFAFQQYSLSERFNEMALNITNLELRIGGLEKQQAEFQNKSSNTPAANEFESLSSRVSALEKRMTASEARKKAPTKSPKQSKATKKRY